MAGPFELTKLSAQISVLMAERSDGGGKNEAIRKSYQNLGTWKTAQNLVRHRGWRGLYSGFHLHLREWAKVGKKGVVKANITQFEIQSVQVSTLLLMRALNKFWQMHVEHRPHIHWLLS